jgi:hypothetical protein
MFPFEFLSWKWVYLLSVFNGRKSHSLVECCLDRSPIVPPHTSANISWNGATAYVHIGKTTTEKQFDYARFHDVRFTLSGIPWSPATGLLTSFIKEVAFLSGLSTKEPPASGVST